MVETKSTSQNAQNDIKWKCVTQTQIVHTFMYWYSQIINVRLYYIPHKIWWTNRVFGHPSSIHTSFFSRLKGFMPTDGVISRMYAPKQILRIVVICHSEITHQPGYILGTAAHLCGLTWVVTTDAVRILRFNFVMTIWNTQNQFHMNTFLIIENGTLCGRFLRVLLFWWLIWTHCSHVFFCDVKILTNLINVCHYNKYYNWFYS